VGAGAGSYEPTDRRVVAIEPAEVMIAQRPAGVAPVVRARAEALPFGDRIFDAGLAVLTIHHWAEPMAGLRELRRVVRDRVVLVTWDPAAASELWLVQRYLPELVDLDRVLFPALDRMTIEALGPLERRTLRVPWDCVDGFLGAYWRRPARYLEPSVQAGISSFHRLAPEVLARGMGQLREELESGRWEEEFGYLRGEDSIDAGYCILIAHL
jgi:SAM-dependent methyltransferase